MRDVTVAYLPDISPQGAVRGFYVMVTDISRTKESERRERRHMLELAHVSRLSSMGKWPRRLHTRSASRWLPYISMYCAAGQRVLRDGSDHGQIKAWLDSINTQTNRASEIVRRVRRFVQGGIPVCPGRPGSDRHRCGGVAESRGEVATG